MKRGLLVFHQGWTDYINCLALISFYSKQFDILYFFCRVEMRDLASFYCKHITNIHFIWVTLEDVNKYLEDNIKKLYLTESLLPSDIDILIHGQFDCFRTDEFKGSYFKNLKRLRFYTAFYQCYNIPISYKISEFEFERDFEKEEFLYNQIVGTETDYICIHCPSNMNLPLKSSKRIINLDQKTNVFFDFIKILCYSKELHLIDSSWAALVYMIQGKYDLCSDIPVFLYNKRNYSGMFKEPYIFKNWTFI